EDSPKRIDSDKEPTGYNLIIEEIYYPSERYNRTVRVLVPSDYSTSEENYPVIYMHDGQNLFSDATAYADEWGVDESLQEIYNEYGLRFIVVGIDNAGVERMKEYSPWSNDSFGVAKGQEYAKFVINNVKPFIDAEYRTKPDAKNTYMFGSSMGGLISHYFMLVYADEIANYGIFSPSYGFSESVFANTQLSSGLNGVKVYLYMGGREGAIMTDGSNRMDDVLRGKFDSSLNNYKYVLNSLGEH
ncbi:alpha/beta hydrolase, partial [Fulvivirga lutimaris]|uniref:alpha/beta hydrolase n=1 Tax=Fulvivirga lutimaris TaxID=1819566 RepID=UPI0012BD3D52